MRPLLGKPGRYASTGGRSRKGPFVLEAAMAKLSYAEQLKSPHWQRKRLEVFEEHGFVCQRCERSKALGIITIRTLERCLAVVCF